MTSGLRADPMYCKLYRITGIIGTIGSQIASNSKTYVYGLLESESGHPPSTTAGQEGNSSERTILQQTNDEY
jgi:hypothetical protein